MRGEHGLTLLTVLTLLTAAAGCASPPPGDSSPEMVGTTTPGLEETVTEIEAEPRPGEFLNYGGNESRVDRVNALVDVVDFGERPEGKKIRVTGTVRSRYPEDHNAWLMATAHGAEGNEVAKSLDLNPIPANRREIVGLKSGGTGDFEFLFDPRRDISEIRVRVDIVDKYRIIP